jgi:hypothetical protein
MVAGHRVQEWPDDVNDAPFDNAAAEETVAPAERIDAILSPSSLHQ